MGEGREGNTREVFIEPGVSRYVQPWRAKSGKSGSPARQISRINGLFIAGRRCRGRRGIHSKDFWARGRKERGEAWVIAMICKDVYAVTIVGNRAESGRYDAPLAGVQLLLSVCLVGSCYTRS